MIEELKSSKKITEEDIVAEVHCLHPNFLQSQLDLSLQNLKLDCLDLYYLHNAAESQLPILGEKKFYEKLAMAFEFLEESRSKGKIKNYGIATWNSFRSPPWEDGIFVNLSKVVELAEAVCGKENGFNYIQLPMSTVMYEGYTTEWQPVDSNLLEQDFL